MITFFKYLFIAGLFVQEIIRFPHRMKNKQDTRQKRFVVDYSSGVEMVMSLVAWSGFFVIPLFYGFTNWLDFADYNLPAWAGWIGAGFLLASTWLLWRAHRDLGRSWSPTLQVQREQRLVTTGVYQYVRHPIYASLWLFALAQVLMLSNAIAGPAGLVAALIVQITRIPREEKMMLTQFGEDYRQYMETTGGVLPRLRRR
ncbi:MAG TPA: protein-S-isoprenylcysteine O-methyltransferase [Anaerolineales bacterium]|nr:protein-S-isoprenylcysteine O-methyltransferase [Anaerolineales bacterium]